MTLPKAHFQYRCYLKGTEEHFFFFWLSQSLMCICLLQGKFLDGAASVCALTMLYIISI